MKSSKLSDLVRVREMGNTESVTGGEGDNSSVPPQDGSGSESGMSSNSNAPAQNLTVVLLSGLSPELVCHADGVGGGIEEFYQRINVDSPLTCGFSGPNGGPGTFPRPNFFPGGGGDGGGGPRPEHIAASFKISALGGLDDQIGYLKRSVLLPMLRPEVLRENGIKAPKGIMFYGPPGTGKTFLAKALVNELKDNGQHVNFFYRKGGDVFSMWFGESARKLTEVFNTAKSMAPSIIFFDEIDGLCPNRTGQNHGTEAYNAVTTCFLGQMDALKTERVFVIGATNRLDAVDPAVRRPGRFDKHLSFGFPDQEARARIFRIQTDKWERDDRPTEDWIQNLAVQAIGYSGADIEKLCKDVVYVAVDENGGVITDSMRIREDHWLRAMGNMQRTSASNFGSAQINPSKPNDTVFRLIEPIVTSAIEKISPFILPQRGNAESIRKSLILCSVAGSQSKNFLRNQIVQGILCNRIFNKMTIFEISEETVFNQIAKGKPTTVSVFHNIINQVLDCTQPAVLVIPNLNEVMATAKESRVENQIIGALAKIRGPNIILLATSSEPLEKLEGNIWTELFNGEKRGIPVANPRRAQLVGFFAGMLEKSESFLVAQMGKAAQVADNDCFEDIMVLYSTLERMVNQYRAAGASGKEQEKALQQRVDQTITNYSQTRFR